MATRVDGHKRDGHKRDGHEGQRPQDRWPQTTMATKEMATGRWPQGRWPWESMATKDGHENQRPRERRPQEMAARVNGRPAAAAAGGVWPLHTAHERVSRTHYSIPHLAYQQLVGCGRCTQHTSRHLALTTLFLTSLISSSVRCGRCTQHTRDCLALITLSHTSLISRRWGVAAAHSTRVGISR